MAAPFKIDLVTIVKGPMALKAIVLTPKHTVVFGRAKLDEVNTGTELSAVDRWLLEQMTQAQAPIAVFRSVNDAGERVWAVDPELGSDETEQLGYVLTRGLLPVHRRMVTAGVALFAHTDWGLKETEAMRGGVRRMLEVLAERPRAHPAVQELDVWILKHLLFHFGMPYQHIIQNVLPDHLRLIGGRAERARELVARLPHAAID